MLLVCCFCDKVHDDAMSQARERLWQDLQVYNALRGPKREDTILSYTCCHVCLQRDPRAIVFRARQSETPASMLHH
jgi:hypothetical protein